MSSSIKELVKQMEAKFLLQLCPTSADVECQLRLQGTLNPLEGATDKGNVSSGIKQICDGVAALIFS